MILLKKAARTLWRGKRSYFACMVLLAVGIAMFIAFHLLYQSLHMAQASFYSEQRFADAFARVRSISLGEADALAGIEGVRLAQGTIVADARVEHLGAGERLVTLRLNSLDLSRQERLNDPVVAFGEAPGEGELLVGVPFLEANGLAVGDTLVLALGGRRYAKTISGGR